MPDPTPTPRFTLRALPLPAKMVVTIFLLAVGLGYFSALVQMHFQHTLGDGTPMPSVNDVIEIFAGKRWVTREEAKSLRPKSKLETLVTGPREAWSSSVSMAPAFFHKDPSGKYKDLTEPNRQKVPPEVKAKVDADRSGEQKIVELWSMLPDDKRKEAYDSDKFVPKDDAPTAITAEFLHGKAIADGVKVKSILTARCAECHQPGGDKDEFPLHTYETLTKYLVAPEGVTVPDDKDGAWCVSSRQMSREKLAQSTHAHLLSFAMLFALTGFVFSFTSYPSVIRFCVAPMVLLAQIADVSCWWLARIEGPGVYFAQAIMVTGAVAGVGLGLQIIGSVFNMYGPKGKVVLVLLFLGAGAGGGFLAKEYGKPFLDEQKAKKLQEEEAAKKAAEEKAKKPKPPEVVGKDEPKPPMPIPMMSPSRLERLLAGEFNPARAFGGREDGGMIRAFFDKEDEFKKRKPPAGSDLFEKRKSEQAAVIAWVQSDEAKRKASYEADKFPLPANLKGKLFTQEFKSDDQNIRIKSLLDARCAACHAPEKKQEDYPLTKYEDFKDYLKPEPK